MKKVSEMNNEELQEYIKEYLARLEEKDNKVKTKEWLQWALDKVNQYGKLDDEGVAYDTSWSKEDKNKFYLISNFHEYLISIAKSLNTPYIDEDTTFETYETNFIYKEKPYHIFTMMGQGVITSIKNGFEDLDKFPPITIDSYYSNN